MVAARHHAYNDGDWPVLSVRAILEDIDAAFSACTDRYRPLRGAPVDNDLLPVAAGDAEVEFDQAVDGLILIRTTRMPFRHRLGRGRRGRNP
jgi:hypothetical protein